MLENHIGSVCERQNQEYYPKHNNNVYWFSYEFVRKEIVNFLRAETFPLPFPPLTPQVFH